MNYLLGVDLGTSGTKTVLFDEDVNVVASKTIEYPLYQEKNGWAEQEPLDWWNAAADTIHAVITESGVDNKDIKGLGISGQMHGLVMLDKDGNVLRRSIIWCDQRTAKECEEITARVGAERLIEITANPALTGFTASKILWVRNNQPEIYAKCAHILLPKDYVRYMLTGDFATEVSDASGMQLLDVPNRCWSDEVLEKLDIDKALLPKVYESPEVTGVISEEAAKRTGLAAGTIVVGGAGDNAAAAVGTGVVEDGKAFTTIGTSGVVFAHTDNISIDPKGRVHTFCCAVPGAWHVMGVTQGAGLSLKWFRDNFCGAEKETAAGMGVDPYYLMDQQAARSPIGCNRLLYLPYLMGERSPINDTNARGTFTGMTMDTSRSDMVQAVLEGVAFAIRDSFEVAKSLGVSIPRSNICGGGAKSPLWRRIFANVLGIPLDMVKTEQGPGYGAAMLAMVGCGKFKSVQEAADKLVEVASTTEPDAELTAKYEVRYQNFKKLYPALKNFFAATV